MNQQMGGYVTHGDYALGQADSDATAGHATRVVQLLLAMRPWIRFFSVLGFIGCGLLAIGGLVFGAVGSLSEELGIAGPLMAVLYLVMAVLYLFPSLHLHRCANALRDLAASGRPELIEDSLLHQHRFWRFMGVAMIVILCLYVVGLVGAVIFAAIAA
jgi:hypothetical protein